MINKVVPFYLQRNEDLTGVSGTGVVAVGVVMPSGTAVLEWLSFESSINIYRNLSHVEDIHGHGGRTLVVMGTPNNQTEKEEN